MPEHTINVQSLMTLVGEQSQVVDIAPVFFLITESMPQRSISRSVMLLQQFLPDATP